MALKYVQTNTFYQAGSGNIIGATSIVLTSFTDIYGNVLTMTDFGTEGYCTAEPDTTNEESFTFTGVTANTNGTYTLTGVKTALAKSPYTETSGMVRQHSGGTKVVVSDTTAFWNTFPNKNNDETIAGQWTFSVFPVTPSNSDASTTVKGVTKVSVAPVLSTNPIAVGDNDGRMPVAYAVDSVGTDSYAITPSPAITAYAAGQVFTFKAGTANTGAATLNVSALGAKTIKKNVSTDLGTGDILSGQIVQVEYDGTNMQMIGVPQNFSAASLTGTIPLAVENPLRSRIFVYSSNKADTAATNTVTINHALGVVPTYVRMTGMYQATWNNQTGIGSGDSYGVAKIDGSLVVTYYGFMTYINTNGNGSGSGPQYRQSLDGIGLMYMSGDGTNGQTATISNITSSNIDLTITKNGTGLTGGSSSQNIYYTVEICY